MKFEIGTINIDSEGRFMFVEAKINDKIFVMGSVYAPVIDEPKFCDFYFLPLLIVLIMIWVETGI